MARRVGLGLGLGLVLAALPLLPACVPQQQSQDGGRRRADVGAARNRYSYLDDKGDVMKAAPGILDVPRGYFTGTLHLSGSGMEKKGAGTGESVLDGDVVIEGSGWRLIGFTVRGDVTIDGENNDVSGIKILGKVHRVKR